MAQNNQKTIKKRGGNTGNGFKKGKSGNPGGRPKIPIEFKELAKANSVIALQKAIDIMNNPLSDPKDILKAADMVMDRGYGKATQALEHSGELKMPTIIIS